MQVHSPTACSHPLRDICSHWYLPALRKPKLERPKHDIRYAKWNLLHFFLLPAHCACRASIMRMSPHLDFKCSETMLLRNSAVIVRLEDDNEGLLAENEAQTGSPPMWFTPGCRLMGSLPLILLILTCPTFSFLLMSASLVSFFFYLFSSPRLV